MATFWYWLTAIHLENGREKGEREGGLRESADGSGMWYKAGGPWSMKYWWDCVNDTKSLDLSLEDAQLSNKWKKKV